MCTRVTELESRQPLDLLYILYTFSPSCCHDQWKRFYFTKNYNAKENVDRADAEQLKFAGFMVCYMLYNEQYFLAKLEATFW